MLNTILTILQDSVGEARRDAYWPRNIEFYGHQIGFLIYLCAFIAVIVLIIGFIRAMRVWFRGKYENDNQSFISFFFVLIKRILRNIFSLSLFRRLYYGIGVGITKRKSMPRSSFLVHSMIMVGFIGSAIATFSITIHEYLFHENLLVGPLYLLLNIGADISGLLLFFGVLMALIRRYIREKEFYPQSSFEDLLLLLLLFWISISGFFIEAARISYGLNNLPIDIHGHLYTNIDFEMTSFIGFPLAVLLSGIFTSNSQIFLIHQVFYLSHLACVLTLGIILTFTKFFHILAGTGNVLLKDVNAPRGKLTFSADGISKIEDFSFYQLLEASACMKCHFCHNYCPAQDSGEPLSPLKVVQDIKNWGKQQFGLFQSNKHVPIMGENQEKSGLTEDVLWACVTCYACVNACPHLIGHVDMIVGMRASLVEGGNLPGTFTTMLESVYNYGNVWNQPKRERTNWLKEEKLPKIKKSESKLLWLPGDTLAYDPRNQKVARATYEIFKTLEIDYGTFGDAEKNDGNEMRRIGEEALFEMLAEENIKMYNKRKVNRIITSSPHAYNTIKNEYPDFGGNFDVVHITEFLWELIESRKLTFSAEVDYEVTYHDPCYLGRYNDIYDIPRKIIAKIPGIKFKEMPNNRQFSYCCGGGGGNMFRETPDWVETRISERRVLEAKETFTAAAEGKTNGSKKVLLTACPFCTSMLTDAIKTQQLEDGIEILDIVELVNEAMGNKN